MVRMYIRDGVHIHSIKKVKTIVFIPNLLTNLFKYL